MLGRIVSLNPQCPKCASYMYMYREKDGKSFRHCTTCGHNSHWLDLRFKLRFWKWKWLKVMTAKLLIGMKAKVMSAKKS